MHFWCGARLIDGDSHQHGHGRWPPCSQHHGQQTYGQCHALWHVPINGQPHGGRRYGSCIGRIGSNALHSHDHGTVGAGRAHGIAGQHARPEQQFKAHVHVGWRDLHQPSGSIHRHGALITFLLLNPTPHLQWTTVST